MKFYTSFFKTKNKVCVRGYDGLEQFFEIYELDNCIVYEEDPYSNTATEKSIYDVPLKPIRFSTAWEASKYIDENHSFKNLWGYPRYDYAKIDELFTNENDPSLLRVSYIDIETYVGEDTDTGLPPQDSFPSVFNNEHAISLITTIQNGQIVCQALNDIDEKYVLNKLEEQVKNFKENYKIKFNYYDNEEKLLKGFVKLINSNSPDIISGWNTNGFDIPYIYARICKVISPEYAKRLSPFNIITTREYINEYGEKALQVNIKGIELLDYLELYKKFELSPRENFKLETIALIETGATKLDYDGSFRDFYLKYFSTDFPAYNIIDVIRVIEIDKEVGFIAVAAQVAYSAKCVFSDVYPVTKIWDNIIANYCREQHIHVPAYFKFSKEEYEGAYVKPTIPGKFKWIITYDVASLYPSIIIQQNISAETILKEEVDISAKDITNRTEKLYKAKEIAENLNATLCANGSLFSKEKIGILPQLVKIYMKKRVTAKNEMKEWSKRIEYAKSKLK
jgi:DNA polymerase elongation subunit (family B)